MKSALKPWGRRHLLYTLFCSLAWLAACSSSQPGSLHIAIRGLPNDGAASISIVGPNDYSRMLSATTTLSDLAPGNYSVIAAPISIKNTLYEPEAELQPVVVSPGVTATVTVSHVLAPPSVTRVMVAPDALELEVGGTVQLEAEKEGVNLASQGVTWSSNNHEVVSVSPSGLITAINPGDATITATSIADPSKSGTSTVAVSEARYTLTFRKAGEGSGSVSSDPEGINCGTSCNAASARYSEGTAVTLKATAAGGSFFTGWRGACTGRSDCVIRGSGDASVIATFEVAPVVALVEVAPQAAELPLGSETFFSAEVKGSNNPPQDVTWTSSNTNVVTVTGSGLVAAVGVGTATLTATSTFDPGKSGTATVTVTSLARVAIQGERWLIDGQLTHPGTRAEGMLLNSRMVNATFDDANPDTISNWSYPDGSPYNPNRQTREFIAALPSYAAHGLNAVTLNFQGGGPKEGQFALQPWENTAFRANGSLRRAYLERMDRAIRALSENGMVAIVGFFYFGQDERLLDEAAVVRAVDNATDWLLSQGYGNVIVEVNNEADLRYDHAILKGNRVHELIKRVQERSKGKLLVSTSFKGGSIPSAAVLEQSDFILLHGNSQTPSSIRAMVDTVRGRLASAKPIVFNEDSTRLENFEAAVNSGASWGYYDQGANDYLDGFQSPPTNWSINTAAKRAFFDKVKTLTSR